MSADRDPVPDFAPPPCAEDDLLARLVAAEQGDALAAPPTGLDWTRFLESARRHSVAPLLFHRLREGGQLGALPAEVARALDERYREATARNLRIGAELARILRALAGAGVDTIVLKGAALAETVYRAPGLRLFHDLDLLVRPDDLGRAAAVLAGLGYRQNRRHAITDQRDQGAHLLPFIRSDRRAAPVEIHWSLIDPGSPFRIDADGLWDRSREATIAGAPARVLGPEDLLLHLCIHGAYEHVFAFGLRFLCDLREVVGRRPGADIETARDRAARWGAARCLETSLGVARQCLPGDWPDADEATDTAASIRIAGDHLWTAGTEPRVPTALARLWGTTGAKEKATGIARGFLPSRQVLALRQMYPTDPRSWKAYAYYAVRAKDVIVRNAGMAARLLLGDPRARQAARRENGRIALRNWLESS
jgi:hypothetical protein